MATGRSQRRSGPSSRPYKLRIQIPITRGTRNTRPYRCCRRLTRSSTRRHLSRTKIRSTSGPVRTRARSTSPRVISRRLRRHRSLRPPRPPRPQRPLRQPMPQSLRLVLILRLPLRWVTVRRRLTCLRLRSKRSTRTLRHSRAHTSAHLKIASSTR